MGAAGCERDEDEVEGTRARRRKKEKRHNVSKCKRLSSRTFSRADGKDVCEAMDASAAKRWASSDFENSNVGMGIRDDRVHRAERSKLDGFVRSTRTVEELTGGLC